MSDIQSIASVINLHWLNGPLKEMLTDERL